MPKTVIGDVFGEMVETGKQTAKSGAQAAVDVTKQAAKTLIGQKTNIGAEEADFAKKSETPTSASARRRQADKAKADSVKRLAEQDKKRSSQAYAEIQRQIAEYRKQQASQPRKYETGKPGFDVEQLKEPEKYWEKVKGAQAEAEKKKKELPLSVKKGQQGVERFRGVSG
jgi:hypothetical protein